MKGEELRYRVLESDMSNSKWFIKALEVDYGKSAHLQGCLMKRLRTRRVAYKAGKLSIEQFNLELRGIVDALKIKYSKLFTANLGWYRKRLLVAAYLCGYVTIDIDGVEKALASGELGEVDAVLKINILR